MTLTSKRLFDEVKKAQKTWPDHKPRYPFELAISTTYQDAFDRSHATGSRLESLLDSARKRGRVILTAEGGTGKSVIVRRVAQQCVKAGVLPVLVDLTSWPSIDAGEWATRERDPLGRLEMLFSIAAPAAMLDDLRACEAPILLVADGLNEIPAKFADGFLVTLDECARLLPQVSVVVTDRLIRRTLPGLSWRVATICPLPPDARTPSLGEMQQIAFFRNLLGQSTDVTTSSRVLCEHVVRDAKLDDDQLNALSEAAFRFYETHKSRTFSMGELEDIVGSAVASRLTHGEIVRSRGERSHFRHHLIHDFLAARYLAARSERWGSSSFNTLTLDRSSFDSMGFLLEQVEGAQTEQLLRLTYDWHPYASAYALQKSEALGSDPGANRMGVALLAMLAERRWDPMAPTAQQSTDALRLFAAPLAQQFLSATDAEALRGMVSAIELADPEFAAWQESFCTPSGRPVTDEMVTALNDEDSLVGWTTANVLRRMQVTPEQRATILQLASSGSEAVRWRAVHVLGSMSEPDVVECLFASLNDEYFGVRHGAIRSLVEIAARSRASTVIERLEAMTAGLNADSVLRSELQRAVIIRAPHSGWENMVSGLVELMWSQASSKELRDQWTQSAYEIHEREPQEMA